jgi:hypothetical protein
MTNIASRALRSSKQVFRHRIEFQVRALMLLASVAFLAGCGGMVNDALTDSVPGAALQGNVHGGQNPVSGATIQLYAAQASGYGALANPLIGSTVTTGSNGNFSITGDYMCPASPNDQVYIVATGGNPGAGSPNANLALMAALGPCSGLTGTTFISINEVTTVASAYALSGFMADYAHVGTSSTNYVGLQNAMATVKNLVNMATGAALSVTPAYATLPTGTVAATFKSVVPQSEIDTLANILASCVNTNGVGESSTACANLFANTATNTTTGGVSGTPDTIQAALNIAKSPGVNVSTIFGLAPSTPPFAPVLSTTPNDFAIGLNFVSGGLGGTTNSNKAFSTALAIDGAGNIWIANSGTSKVTELSNLGVALSPNTETSPAIKGGFSASDVDQPLSLAVDTVGNAWIGNIDGIVSEFGPAGTEIGSVTGGGLVSGEVTGLAIDGSNRVWAADYSENLIAEFSNVGVPLSGSGYNAGISGPNGGLAIDGSGHVYVANSGNGMVVKLSNSGGFLATSSNVLSNSVGSGAIDGLGDFWIPSTTLIQEFAPALTNASFNYSSLSAPGSVSVDGAGHVWTADSGGASGQATNANLTEIASSNGALLSPGSTGYTGVSTGGTSLIIQVASNEVDSSGNLWLLNGSAASSVTEFVGLAAPTYAPLAAAVAANKIGQRP